MNTSADSSSGCACSGHCAAAPSPRPADDAAAGGQRSTFRVPGMDCPSEERLIRMALDGADGLRHIGIDLAARTVTLHHEGPLAPLQAKLAALGFGAELLGTDAAGARPEPATNRSEAGVLRTLLAINAAMFVFELASGLWAQSTGLIADALDMLADASVYGLSLYAVGRSAAGKLRVAHLSGWLQLLLAGGALAEVVRRAVSGSEPEPLWMSGAALLALAANVACLLLMARHRDGGAHMKASWIFSTNDVLANAGVIIAGGLVAATGTRWPDLFIGTAIALLVASGALRILKLRA
ncbi:cation transporter [Methyloversatilis sp. MC4-4]|uniref:cation transporter n=1 Tax=Methyloversatilis sp. MC4-4 TaxID=3132824 RepID=UPI003CF4F5D7